MYLNEPVERAVFELADTLWPNTPSLRIDVYECGGRFSARANPHGEWLPVVHATKADALRALAEALIAQLDVARIERMRAAETLGRDAWWDALYVDDCYRTTVERARAVLGGAAR